MDLTDLNFLKNSLPMTSWFAGHLIPEERSTTQFTIENPTENEIITKLNLNKLSLISKIMYNGDNCSSRTRFNSKQNWNVFIPNYVRLLM